MALLKQFESKLNKTFRIRVSKLFQILGKSHPGPLTKLTKYKIGNLLENLEELSRAIITKRKGKKEFKLSKIESRRWHPKKNKGWSRDSKKESFSHWFDNEVPIRNCVYVFWSPKKCLYVGRTMNGKGQPQSHFKEHWFNQTTQIDIHIVKSINQLHKAECLAIDRFEPHYNKNKSSKWKYYKKCPVCTDVNKIKSELSKIFRLK